MGFKMSNGKDVYEVSDPSGNISDWTVVKQESFKLNKGELILAKFNKEFDFDIIDYKELTETCSRSKAFTEWLINANLLYAEEAQLPLFVKDVISPGHFKRLQSQLTSINEVISKSSIKKRELAEKYKADLIELEKIEVKNVNNIKGDDKFLKILSLNSTYLPFTLQLQINRYTPKDEENSQESRDVFAREVLINYKRTLCKMVKDLPVLDIDSLIERNLLK